MKTQIITILATLSLAVFIIGNISAGLIVNNVDQDKLYPGQTAGVDIKLKNDFDYTVDNVKLTLIFNQINALGQVDLTKPTIFSPVGSSQDDVDEIQDGDSETFSFIIKSSNSISPGDYNLPYQVQYESRNGSTITEVGSIGVRVNSKTLIDYSISQEKKVIGMEDKITLKMINKGFGEIKFASINFDDSSRGITLLSDNKVYIGSVASDDFETATFNVLINKANPTITAVVSYKDFENNDRTETVNFDLTAYSRERALQLGIITNNYTGIYVLIIIILIALWIVIRAIRKARKRRMNNLNKGG